MMIVMFSLNKWEMLYNGTGWAHFLAFGLFFWNYALLDQVYEKGFRNAKKSELVLLFVLPFVITIGAAGPYCAIYTVTIVMAYVYLRARYCNCKEFIWKISGKGRQTEFKQHG